MVCTQDKLKWLGVGFILTANLVGCSKKDSADPAAIVEIPQTVVSSGQPATILSGSGPIMLPTSLSGLPSDPSSATSISITVSGQGLTEYRYAITKDIGNCNDATYSDPRSPSVTIDEAITEDGIWSVCVLAAGVDSQGVPKVASLSHSWMHDSTAPSVSILAPSGFGPNISGNSNFTIALSASDGGSGLTSVGVSLQRAGGNCLNQDRSAFDANCPTFIETIGNNLSLTIPSEEFESEVNYIFTAMAIDATGNSQASSSLTLNWDATPPAAPAALTAVPGQELANLSWSSVSGAAYYAVARRLGSPVDGVPSGSGLVSGITFGGSNLIVYFGSNNSFQDTELLPFQNYHYEVFALDAAKNISTSGAKAKAQPDAKPAFQGLTYAYLQADRGIKTEWQQFAFAGNQASTVYDIYQSTVSNDLLTGGSDTQTTGASSLTFPIEDENASDAYLVARASAPGYSQDRNKRELRVKLSSGVMHKIASNGRFDGSEPLGQTFLRNAWTVDIDPWGNHVFTATNGTIQVLCRESAQAYYCKGRTNGAVYTIAGTDGIEDGADGMLASASPMGQIYGIDFDSSGNLYIADYTYARVRVICFNPLAPGFCNAKEIGFSYHIAGTGTVVDGGNDTVARTTPIGLPNDIALDSFGNIFFADSSYRRIRAVCYVASGPVCSGKVLGNMFHVAGNGILADGADASARLTANFGEPRALAIDSLNNLWFADWDYRRIRAVCLDVASSGSFCTGKTSGLVYRVMGTGAAVDGGDNVAADTAGMGQAYGLAVSNHNIYVSDSTFPRIRVICQNTSVTGFCSGKTAGRVYRTAGSGAATDGANNTIALVAALGGPRHLDVDQHGNIVVADDTSKRLRLICKVPASGRFPRIRILCQNTSGGFCSGRTAGNVYRRAGTGASANGANNALATATATGVPTDLAIDPWGNVFFGDTTFPRVRAICNNTSGGFCAGRTAGNVYWFAGTGTTGDGADNVLATAGAISTLGGIVADSLGNIFLGDQTGRRIRAICVDTSSGYCSGLTVNNVYRMYGNGAAITDSASGITGSLVRLDTPSRDGLSFNAAGDLVYGGSSGALRLFIGH